MCLCQQSAAPAGTGTYRHFFHVHILVYLYEARGTLNFDPQTLRMKSHWPDILTGSGKSLQMSEGLIDDDSCNKIKLIWILRCLPLTSYWKCPMLLWPWQRSNWSGWCVLGSSSKDVSSIKIKIFQIQRWQFVPPSKFQMWKLSMIVVILKTWLRSNL